jgi:hypothetical protein
MVESSPLQVFRVLLARSPHAAERRSVRRREEGLGRTAYFLSIAVNASLWTLILAACIATYAYPDDPESMEAWGLTWIFSLPFVLAVAGISALSYPAYLDADSELLRFLLYLSMVLAAGFTSPLGWAVLSRVVALGRAAFYEDDPVKPSSSVEAGGD